MAERLGVEYSAEGVKVLGTFLENDGESWFSLLPATAALPKVSQARLEKATAFGNVLLRVLEHDNTDFAAGPAVWHLLRTSLACALDFDTHIIPTAAFATACGA